MSLTSSLMSTVLSVGVINVTTLNITLVSSMSTTSMFAVIELWCHWYICIIIKLMLTKKKRKQMRMVSIQALLVVTLWIAIGRVISVSLHNNWFSTTFVTSEVSKARNWAVGRRHQSLFSKHAKVIYVCMHEKPLVSEVQNQWCHLVVIEVRTCCHLFTCHRRKK